MKLSLNWIKKYIDLPENISPKQIAYDLTLRTVEVENVETDKNNDVTEEKNILNEEDLISLKMKSISQKETGQQEIFIMV